MRCNGVGNKAHIYADVVDKYVCLTPVLKQRGWRGGYLGVLGLARVRDDSINHDKLRFWCGGIAEVSKHLDSILIGPIVNDIAKEEDVCSLAELRLWLEEVVADELDLFILDGARQMFLPVLWGRFQNEVSMVKDKHLPEPHLQL